jgi:hypothetical protein
MGVAQRRQRAANTRVALGSDGRDCAAACELSGFRSRATTLIFCVTALIPPLEPCLQGVQAKTAQRRAYRKADHQ